MLNVIRGAEQWVIEMSEFENFDLYSKYTEDANWADIFKLNGIAMDSFGTKKELKVLPKYLEKGEVVFALTSGMMGKTDTSNSSDFGTSTWLVALTNERFLFLDHAMLSTSVDTQSIRHDRVQAVSASQGWILGKIMVDLGSRVVVIDNCQKATVSVIADLANKWLRLIEAKKLDSKSTHSVNNGSEIDKLERLAGLFSSGALTPEEFSLAKKAHFR